MTVVTLDGREDLEHGLLFAASVAALGSADTEGLDLELETERLGEVTSLLGRRVGVLVLLSGRRPFLLGLLLCWWRLGETVLEEVSWLDLLLTSGSLAGEIRTDETSVWKAGRCPAEGAWRDDPLGTLLDRVWWEESILQDSSGASWLTDTGEGTCVLLLKLVVKARRALAEGVLEELEGRVLEDLLSTGR